MEIENKRILQKYAKPSTFTDIEGIETPLPFSEWYSSRFGIIPGNEYKQYNDYLIEWYKNKKDVSLTNRELIKKNYLLLLKQLQIFYSDEEVEGWYKNINLDNEDDLLRSIPYFAKKLKEITLYYLQLRKDVQSTRFVYNQLGTNDSILQQIRQFLLTNYTLQSDNIFSLPYNIQKNLPSLSSINNTLNLQIQELYDICSYLDQSPTLPASAYYDTNNDTLRNILLSKNLELSSAEWLYKLGTYPLSTVYNVINETENTVPNLNTTLLQKYLGTTITHFISSVANPVLSTQKDFYTIDITRGNNFFYWPAGAYKSNIFLTPTYKPVALTALNIESLGIAGSSIDVSDTIFVKTAQDTQGAWLREKFFNEEDKNLQATLYANTKTVFRYPYPGYGLSATDLPWTGYDFFTNPRFLYLEDEIKKSIETVYWSSGLSGTTDPLLLNNTTLVQCSAHASTNYQNADKIRTLVISPDYTNTSVNQDYNEAWLYRFERTDIPIKSADKTVIYWPYENINTEEDFPNYYPEKTSDICLPVPVSSIDVSSIIAGNTLSGSDVLYKLTNYEDTIENATECCWLSGQQVTYPNTKLVTTQQQELQLLVNSGEYVSFIWTGPNNTNVNTVFKTLQHQPDCKFATTPNITYLNHNLCTCKQVLFTPFGHPGTSYSDYNSLADFIIENNYAPANLDLTIWKDSTNTGYAQSSAFCWYKTDKTTGWGNGTWYSGNPNTGNNFLLQTGKSYTYYRAEAKIQSKNTTTLPSYILRHPYGNSSRRVWMKAYKNQDNIWVPLKEPTSMVLYPGDLISYQRVKNTTFSLSSVALQTVDIAENRGSAWTTYDYISINKNPVTNISKQVILSYPNSLAGVSFEDNINPNDPQYPKLNPNNFVNIVQWSVTAPNLSTQYFRNTSFVTVNITLTGLYTFSVTALSAAQVPLTNVTTPSGYYIFTNIPAVTAVSDRMFVASLTGFDTPAPGFTLNLQLSGWTYPTTIYSTSAVGAKPYWAQTFINRDENTNFKGINDWGTPQRFFNEHNIVTQPPFSDITLDTGNYFEYYRGLKTDLVWNQPILYKTFAREKIWSVIELSTSTFSNLSSLLNNIKTDIITKPSTAISPIILQNFVDNEPVEVYYNALESFTWNVTAEPLFSQTVFANITSREINPWLEKYIPQTPWHNPFNQNFPTVAATPAFNKLYDKNEIGGYFLPKNLGVTTYFDKDTITQIEISALNAIPYFASENKINSIGLSKTEQNSPYKIVSENCVWQKEPTTSNAIAGTNNKKAFKRYQKFIPYTSGYEKNSQNRIGIINQASKQTPWVGPQNDIWGDFNTYPISPVGELNINVWKDAQFLKNSELQLDNWVTDIFGNQYGLYKPIKNKSFISRKNTLGVIWVRDNAQNTKPSKISLKNVFDTYKSTTLINSLTGTKVKRIDTFFDTLFVEAQNVLFFEKINYDYNTNNIFSISDDARHISLALPVSLNINREFDNKINNNTLYAKAGETWFFPNEKRVIVSVISLSSVFVTPELYRLDLINNNLAKIFPILPNDQQQLTTFNSLNLTGVNEPLLTYNSLTNEFVMAFTGTNLNNETQLIELTVLNSSIPELKEIQIYSSTTQSLDLPIINQPLEINITQNNNIDIRYTPVNGPATFTIITRPSWLRLSSTGRFTGIPTTTGVFYSTFTVSNNYGSTYYTLTINVT